MEQTTHSFANRCPPMHIANRAGWFVLNDRALRAIWLGGTGSDAVLVEQEGNPPYAAISHFGCGILTFTMPYPRPGKTGFTKFASLLGKITFLEDDIFHGFRQQAANPGQNCSQIGRQTPRCH
jgi:hypothetical protein